MKAQATRRRVLGGLAALPALTLTATASASSNDDAAILKAWNERQRALAVILARGSFFDAVHHSSDTLNVFSNADERVMEGEATSPQALLAQAWVAWSFHCGGLNRPYSETVLRADFATLDSYDGRDWDQEVMLRLIRGLRRLAGVGR